MAKLLAAAEFSAVMYPNYLQAPIRRYSASIVAVLRKPGTETRLLIRTRSKAT